MQSPSHQTVPRAAIAASTLRHIGIAMGFVLAAVLSQPEAAAAEPGLPSTALHVVASTNEAIWNGVAVDDAGRIYVSTPRWTGAHGPSVARLDARGKAEAFPDARWNAEDATVPLGERFVNVNAMHRDANGGLWIVDTGVSGFGGTVVPGAAKLVRVDLATGRVTRVYALGADVARAHSYVDDIRVNGRHAYLTDAGDPAVIVLDIDSGRAVRVLQDHRSTRAAEDRDIVVEGQVVRGPDGKALRVHADPLEVSPDGRWLYFAALSGPWWRIETRYLDAAVDAATDGERAQAVATIAAETARWADLPPVGGTAMDAAGNLYYSDLAHNALRRITPDLRTETILEDARLHWVDAPVFDSQGRLYLPVPQIDRVRLFQHGASRVQWPVHVYRLDGLPSGRTMKQHASERMGR
ncbi:major royal jelly family protein [Cupriavidus plantarum]|uniref:Major royal jelly protein n=1 Tax=Cupriavidus plantarum TaxID=942865 RepID=A0A316F282_9BURK|nr:major royal jelly family protein [Cupriavidus plantarum]PWK37838.1 major royal jelly protein [Cupriavidus plantarum]